MSLLDQEGELVALNKTSAQNELAALTAKVDGKQAILFEKVRGSKIGVACNIVGTAKKFYLAVAGTRKASQADVKKAIHARIMEALSSLSEPAKIQSAAPFETNSSRNLHDLPIVTHFEKDAGPFITSSVVFAKDNEKGNQNQSTHRLLRLDDRHMAIRMVEGRHLHKCFTYARDHGEDLKVAIAIGVHPAVSIAAAYQAAYGVDEMMIANSLLEGRLSVSKAGYSQLHYTKPRRDRD